VVRFDDQHMIAADDAARLSQNNFDHAGIFFQFPGDVPRFCRWFYASETNNGILRFRNNLLSDDQDVAIFEAKLCAAGRGGDVLAKIIAWLNFWDARQREQLHARGGRDFPRNRVWLSSLRHNRS
jgi:hypothetical protein